MKRNTTRLFSGLTIILCLIFAFALSVSAQTGLSEDQVKIGETVNVSLDVPSGARVSAWSCTPYGALSFSATTNTGTTYKTVATAVKPGEITVRATVKYADNTTSTVTVGTLLTVLEDGIYTVGNQYADDNYSQSGAFYLRSQITYPSSGALYVAQHSQNNFGDITNKIYNYWYIEHQGSGQYTIRSVANESKALTYSGSTFSLSNIGSTVTSAAKWYIRGENIIPVSATTKCLALNSPTPTGTYHTDGNPYYYFGIQVNTMGGISIENWNFEKSELTADDFTGVIGISDNTSYYIMNYASRKYLALETPSNANSTVNTQIKGTTNAFKWTTEKLPGLNFKLISDYSSTSKVLTFSSNTLKISTNVSSTEQKFELERIDTPGDTQGLYYIKQGTSYIAQDPSSSTGRIIKTSTRSANAIWSFMAVDKGNVEKYGVFYSGHNSTTEDQFYYKFNDIGFSSTCFVNQSAEFAYERLDDMDILIIISHGNAGKICFYTDTGGHNGYIVAHSDLNEPNKTCWFINELPNNSLSNLRCVFLIGCYTGEYNGEYNLVNEFYNKGAHFVLGSTELLAPSAGNDFIRAYNSKVLYSDSVDDLLNRIDEMCTFTLIEDYDGDGDSDGFKYSDVFPSYVVGDVYQTIN